MVDPVICADGVTRCGAGALLKCFIKSRELVLSGRVLGVHALQMAELSYCRHTTKAQSLLEKILYDFA